MKPVQNIPTGVQKYLDNAWPRNGKVNTLALGEEHSWTDHMVWLKDHIDELIKRDVTTIGLEMAPHLNVFLWAYQDGTLERLLGSHDKARNYICTIFNFSNQYQTKSELPELLLTAMDRGIAVVAYDSRYLLAQEKAKSLKNDGPETLQKAADKLSAQQGIDGHTYQQHMRETSDSEAVFQLFNRLTLAAKDLPRDTVTLSQGHNLLEFHYTRLTIQKAWLLNEVDWLLQSNPAYQQKLEAIEGLVETGHKKISAGSLTSDALSAVVFDAMAQHEGNRLTIGGVSHIAGMADWRGRAAERVHGTFDKHLRELFVHEHHRANSSSTMLLMRFLPLRPHSKAIIN